MSYESLTEGRYRGMISDHGLSMVEQLNVHQAWIKFDFKDNAGKSHSMSWKGFLKKKDGNLNQQTMNTLMICGFKGRKATDLNNQGAIDMTKEYDLTIEIKNGYFTIQWVNDPADMPSGSKVSTTDGYDLAEFDNFWSAHNPPIKNHAPQKSGTQTNASDGSDELGF